MVVRALLALVAMLVLGWVGVLLRNYEIGREAAARSFLAEEVSEARRREDLQRLEDAQLLDPSSYWDLARVAGLLRSGDEIEATRAATALVREEPDNVLAWRALRQATRKTDPARSARAAARIRQLDPLGGR